MSSARVIPLKSRDPALTEEAQAAARIFRGVHAGDAAATKELLERYSQGLLYLLRRRIGDDERARDLLHDTFCIALEKLRNTNLEYPERLAGYLRGIAVRVAMNGLRRRSREPIPVDDQIISSIRDLQPRPFQQVSREQTGIAVRELLETMPVARDRELLLRYFVYDHDKEQICRELGLDSLHFNRVLFRAKGRFRKILEKALDSADLATQ